MGFLHALIWGGRGRLPPSSWWLCHYLGVFCIRLAEKECGGGTAALQSLASAHVPLPRAPSHGLAWEQGTWEMESSHVPWKEQGARVSVITDHPCQYSHQADAGFLVAPLCVCGDRWADPPGHREGGWAAGLAAPTRLTMWD